MKRVALRVATFWGVSLRISYLFCHVEVFVKFLDNFDSVFSENGVKGVSDVI